MRQALCVLIGVGLLLGAAVGARPAQGDQAHAAAAVVASLWTAPAEDGVTLQAAGQSKPTTAPVAPDTLLRGICDHCQMVLQFKPADAGKSCGVCSCSISNAECVVGKVSKPVTWQKMLAALPRGTGLRVVFNDAAKPESGVKSLTVDRKSALLAVEGLESKTPSELTALGKAVHAKKVESAAGGKQLVLTLGDVWTPALLTKLQAAVTQMGGHLAEPPSAAKTE